MTPGDLILAALIIAVIHTACRLMWRERITYHDADEHDDMPRRDPEQPTRDGGV